MSGIQKVGIVGAGQMGSGIAHVCALSGMDVVLQDLALDKVEQGLATISGNMTRQAGKGIIKEDEIKPALARITASDSYENMADCDLVIESATEDETIKRKILAQLAPVVKSSSILATNTSSISITRLAASTDRPEKFIGIHFMNPVPLMELVEVVRGIATDDETYEASRGLLPISASRSRLPKISLPSS